MTLHGLARNVSMNVRRPCIRTFKVYLLLLLFANKHNERSGLNDDAGLFFDSPLPTSATFK